MTDEPKTPNPRALLTGALIACQSEIGTITKDKTAKAGAYGYTYADLPAVLEAITPALHGNGLCITQTVDAGGINGGPPTLVTTLLHIGGGDLRGSYPLLISDMNDPQKLGGAITYARRYSILAMLNLSAEDDDAAHARTPRATGTVRAAAALGPDEEDFGPATRAPQPRPVSRPAQAPPSNGGYRGDNGDDPELTGTMTPKQWGMLMATGRKQKMDREALDDLATSEFGKLLHELDRGEASTLIDSLLNS